MENTEDSPYFRGQSGPSTINAGTRPRQQYLTEVIARAAELLPGQGPITAFAFLNPLQALEHVPFDEGVRRSARLHSFQPYLTESRYREKISRNRILWEDVEAVIRDELGNRADKAIRSLGTRLGLRMAMLRIPLITGPAGELKWFVAETDSMARLQEGLTPLTRKQLLRETRRWVMRDVCGDVANRAHPHPHAHDRRMHALLDDLLQRYGESTIENWSDATWESLTVQAMWRLCRRGVHSLVMLTAPTPPPVRHRDALLRVTGQDSDWLVQEVLIPFCQAFTDQGFAHWALPHRDGGFYRAFRELYRRSAFGKSHWLQGLAKELERIELAGLTPLDSIAESLELLGVVEDEWDDYVTVAMLSLRGWAGMIHQMELRGDRFSVAAKPGSLVEFLSVRLILDRLALRHLARTELGFADRLDTLREWLRSTGPAHGTRSIEQRAFPLFQLVQFMGWSPATLCQFSKDDWRELIGEIEAFSGLERRRTFHLAYERRFRVRALDALSIHSRRRPERVETPWFQAVFCLDAREESFRRHIEELEPAGETFGAAGFFGVPMYFRGIADAHFSVLSPIGIQPRHWVTEEAVIPLEGSNRFRARARRAMGATSHWMHVSSRSIAKGTLLTAGLGVLASVPLVARVLFPRFTAVVRQTASGVVGPPPITRLQIERLAETAGPEEYRIGFSIAEMGDLGERFLRDTGLTAGFARLVLFVGHGATCLNNPHKSAYDCGACSGASGGPNARALAAMLNDSRVRRILERRGLEIPDETRFVGGVHNTTNDSVTFFDLDLLPKYCLTGFRAVERIFQQACERNAHERCRRFESAPLKLSRSAAHRHVEGRSEDLAQTRPEFGNATNAVCVVGRRERTRGLFLDRRSFLVSYDPTTDDAEHSSLGRLLGAVVPVCEGINLQYMFSHIDPNGWGSGTKLPHNVTSLLGVMDGSASDLRTGLPWQGVEIHEPMRLLMVVETTPEAIPDILEKNETIGRIIRNGWVQLAVLSPTSSEILVYRDEQFHPYCPASSELPRAESSIDWYRGWRDHLPFAVIGGEKP